MSQYIKAKCRKGETITSDDLRTAAYTSEDASGWDILAGDTREEMNEILQVQKNSAEVAEALNSYCGEIKRLREEGGEDLLDAYVDMAQTMSQCVQQFYADAILLQDRYTNFWAGYEGDTNRANMSTTAKGSWNRITGQISTSLRTPAEHVFTGWAQQWEMRGTEKPPHEEGWYFKPYKGESEKIVKLKTRINVMMLIMESNIWSSTNEHSGIDNRLNRTFAGEDEGAMDSAGIAFAAKRAAEINLRYLMGVEAFVEPDDVDARSASGAETTTMIADALKTAEDFYDIVPVEYEDKLEIDPDGFFRSKYNSAYLPILRANVKNLTSYLVQRPEAMAGSTTKKFPGNTWFHSTNTGAPPVEVMAEGHGSGQQVIIPRIGYAEYDAEWRATRAMDTVPSNLGFYDFDGEVDYEGGARQETCKVNTGFYSDLIGFIESLHAEITATTPIASTLLYLDAMKTYVKDVEKFANRLSPSIECIITAWVEFNEEQEDFEDAAEDARKAFKKELKEDWGFFDPNAIVGDPTEMLATEMEKLVSRSLEDFEAELYRRDPEKLFYREQCFLLTYIGLISEDKRRRQKMVHKIGGGWGAPEIALDKPFSRKRLPYTTVFLAAGDYQWKGNASLLMDGDPYAFLNKLAVSKNLGPLLNINSEMLSTLQPYIRLFKVEFDEETGEEKDIEISFEPAFTTFEQELFTRQDVRNSGTGLKSFQFTYDGSNPFGAKKSIKATLKLFSNSFDELMMPRPSPTRGILYRYVDLAIKTFNKGESKLDNIIYQNEELAKLNFRLKAQVGYSIPKNTASYSTRTDMLALQNALRDSVVTLNLIPTVHDFAFDELGRVNFTINYLAYVEDTFSQAKFNVFSEKYFAVKRIIRDLKMKYYSSECEGKAIDDIKKSYAMNAAEELSDSLSNLFTTMMEREKTYYMPLSTEQIKKFVSFGPFATEDIFGKRSPKILTEGDYTKSLEKSINDGLKTYKDRFSNPDPFTDKEERVISASLAAMDPEKNILSFFYVSDLIDIILENIETELREVPTLLASEMPDLLSRGVSADQIEEKIKEYKNYLRSFKKTRFLLGPVEFVDHSDSSKSMFVNLGDIPISVKYFFEWITSTMLDRDNNFYSLTTFMNEFFNDLVSKFLNNDRCFDYSVKQRTRLNQATLLSSAHGHKDRITAVYVRNQRTRMNIDEVEIQAHLPLIRTFGNVSNSAVSTIDSADETNYMIYFVGRTLPTEQMRGIRTEDEKKGIFHYQIGRDAGLVKDIKLTKTQTPGLQEVRFEQEGYDGLEQLRVVYDAQIESYANVNTFPGSYCYIDPAGYAPTTHPGKLDLTKYGVGGYYMIVKSEHTFAPGKADSIIEAKWVNKLYDPNDAVKDILVRDQGGTQDKKGKKCSSFVDRAAKAAGRESET